MKTRDPLATALVRDDGEPFQTLAEVHDAMRAEGLETCELIVAIDFTPSNTWQVLNPQP
jgi:hypothetical protein